MRQFRQSIKSHKFLIVICFALIIAFPIYTVYKASAILGPKDKPDFAKMDWQSINVCYFVRTDKTPRKIEKHHVEITDINVIANLKKDLNIIDEHGTSMASQGDTKLKLSDGTIWGIDFIFEDEIWITLQKNNYYAYTATLRNRDFYNELLDICLEHEKQTNPSATLRNMTLLDNLDASCMEVLASGQNTNKSF